jgi:hypothetical protein
MEPVAIWSGILIKISPLKFSVSDPTLIMSWLNCFHLRLSSVLCPSFTSPERNVNGGFHCAVVAVSCVQKLYSESGSTLVQSVQRLGELGVDSGHTV